MSVEVWILYADVYGLLGVAVCLVQWRLGGFATQTNETGCPV